jgi:hypothetical protein
MIIKLLITACFYGVYLLGRWSQRIRDEEKQLNEDIKKLRK